VDIKTTIKQLHGGGLCVVNNCHVLAKADESFLSLSLSLSLSRTRERVPTDVFQEPFYPYAQGFNVSRRTGTANGQFNEKRGHSLQLRLSKSDMR